MTTNVFSSPNLPALQSKNNLPEIEIISGEKENIWLHTTNHINWLRELLHSNFFTVCDIYLFKYLLLKSYIRTVNQMECKSIVKCNFKVKNT